MNLGDPLVFWILHHQNLEEVKRRNEHLPGVVDSMFRHCEYHGYVSPIADSTDGTGAHFMSKVGPYRRTEKGNDLYQRLIPAAQRMALI